MAAIFCCSDMKPFKSTRTDHESNFTSFLSWSKPKSSNSTLEVASGDTSLLREPTSFVIQVVRQFNHGSIEFKRYFATAAASNIFQEITEGYLIEANFEKLNSYKNFRCLLHHRFFELNLYKKDPVNKHHWRANIARPATEIDLPAKGSSSSVRQPSTTISLDFNPPTEQNTEEIVRPESNKTGIKSNNSIIVISGISSPASASLSGLAMISFTSANQTAIQIKEEDNEDDHKWGYTSDDYRKIDDYDDEEGPEMSGYYDIGRSRGSSPRR